MILILNLIESIFLMLIDINTCLTYLGSGTTCIHFLWSVVLTFNLANVLWPVVMILFDPAMSLILRWRRFGVLSIIKVGSCLWSKLSSWWSHLLIYHCSLWLLKLIDILESRELRWLVLRMLSLPLARSCIMWNSMYSWYFPLVSIELTHLYELLIVLSELSGTWSRLKLLRHDTTSFGRKSLIFERTGIVVSVPLMARIFLNWWISHIIMRLLHWHRKVFCLCLILLGGLVSVIAHQKIFVVLLLNQFHW